MIKKLLILFLAVLVITSCQPVAVKQTVYPTAEFATSSPAITVARTSEISATPYPPPPTQEALPTAAHTQPAVRTITDLGTEPRSVSFSDKEPWLGVLIDPYENGQPAGQAVVILDYNTGAQIRTIRHMADTGSEAPLVFRPGSTEFVTGSSSGLITLWDAATGQALGNFPAPEKDWTSSFAFSPDGKTLAAGFSKEVRIWDVTNRRLIKAITPDITPVRVSSLAFAPDGQTLAYGTESGVLFRWDAGKKQSQVIGYTLASSLAFSPDGKWLAEEESGSPVVLWDTTHWVKRVVLADVVIQGADENLAFSRDGKSLAVSVGGNVIQVWDTDHLVMTQTLNMQADYILGLAYVSDRHILAAGVSNQALAISDLGAASEVGLRAPAPTVVPDDLSYVFPQPLQPGSPPAVNGMKMFDEHSGWAFATDGPSRMSLPKHYLLHTVDGGRIWKEAALPQNVELGNFFALDANTAWVAPAFYYQVDANSVVIPYKSLSTWRTNDGGQTWQQSQPFSLAPKWAKDGGADDYGVHMQFLDRDNGWMLVNVDCPTARGCQWQLYRTGDGGMNWQRVSESDPYNPAPNQPLLFSVAFWDERTGWGAGSVIGYTGQSKAALSVTRDGAQTWGDMPIPPPENLPEDFKSGQSECGATSVERIGENAVAVRTQCLVYNNNSPRYFFYHFTPDRGKTWNAWQTNGTEDFINATTGWRIESPGTEQLTKVLHTSDSGATWTVISSVPWAGSLYFVSNQVGWAIARQVEATALLKTIDGGKTWVNVMPVVGQ